MSVRSPAMSLCVEKPDDFVGEGGVVDPVPFARKHGHGAVGDGTVELLTPLDNFGGGVVAGDQQCRCRNVGEALWVGAGQEGEFVDDRAGVVEVFVAGWRELGENLIGDADDVAVEPVAGVGDVVIEASLRLGTRVKSGSGSAKSGGSSNARRRMATPAVAASIASVAPEENP